MFPMQNGCVSGEARQRAGAGERRGRRAAVDANWADDTLAAGNGRLGAEPSLR